MEPCSMCLLCFFLECPNQVINILWSVCLHIADEWLFLNFVAGENMAEKQSAQLLKQQKAYPLQT